MDYISLTDYAEVNTVLLQVSDQHTRLLFKAWSNKCISHVSESIISFVYIFNTRLIDTRID